MIAAVLPAAPVVAADVAFYVVFAAFVAAFAVLSVITVRWALRRDRMGRDQWLRKQEEQRQAPPKSPSPSVNGRPPKERRRSRGAPG